MSKRDRIIEAAARRFRHYGIRKSTMQEIAQDANLAVGTLYLYFGNKDELVVACADEYIERHKSEIASVLASREPADAKLVRYLVGRFRHAAEVRTNTSHAVELARAVFRVKPDRIEDEAAMMWDTMTRILVQGVDDGLFTIDAPAADAKVLMFSIAYFFPNALNEPRIPPTKEDLLMVVNWFIRAWKGKPARARKPSKPRSGDRV